MSGRLLLSIDIGSTYTKGGLFLLEGEDLRPLGRAVRPTTADDLGCCFAEVRSAVLAGSSVQHDADPQAYRSIGLPRPAAGSRSPPSV
jgi:hypothetical protein